MRSFEATIDLPILIHVEDQTAEDATEVADQRFATAYMLIEEAVAGWRAGGVWPEGTHLGARYDDTEITEVTAT